jgi:hypothetical protein
MTSPEPRRITARPGTVIRLTGPARLEIARIRDSRAVVVLHLEPGTEFVREEASGG